ncbi:hypothetical protein Q9L58_006535 [Maublancomyces gigas]|uniref:RING-type domain-containing protein n=1 Tax=Discina gigas TaxID=1032678 RepID=A0ABR3GEY4_9PEZI
MAKKKAARRTGRQTGADQGGSSASNSAPTPQSLLRRELPNPTPAAGPTAETPHPPRHGGQNDSPPRAAAVDPLPAENAFEVVTSIHRPVLATFDRQMLGSQDDYDARYPPECYYSNPSLDSYIRHLLTRPHEATTDPTMDFDETLEEISVLPSTPPLSSPAGEERSSMYRDPPREVSRQSIAAPFNRGGTHMDISVESDQRFSEHGVPRRPTHSEASSSGSRAPGSWATVLRNSLAPGTAPARAISRPAMAVPTTPIPFPTITSPTPAKPALVARPASHAQLDHRKLAEDASILLELFSKTAPDSTDDCNQQLIATAFESIAQIHRHYRVLAAAQNGVGNAAQKRVENDDLSIDAGCIVCYSEVADTVLLPCHHLVLCSFCCETMGIKTKPNVWARKVSCPICRADVLDTIKIFR